MKEYAVKNVRIKIMFVCEAVNKNILSLLDFVMLWYLSAFKIFSFL